MGKPYPFGKGSQGFPYTDPLTGGSLADIVTGFVNGGRRLAQGFGGLAADLADPRPTRLGGGRRRQMSEVPAATQENAAASATQYGRYASDLRSTNGHVQKRSDGRNLTAIETYGGNIAFNVDECWYLDSTFCAPLHGLKMAMGSESALAMLDRIAWGSFGLGLLAVLVAVLVVTRHQVR